MFNILRKVNYIPYNKINRINRINRFYSCNKEITNYRWINNISNNNFKLGITNNFKSFTNTGNFLDVIFSVQEGDVIRKNDIVAYFVGVNQTKKLYSPFNCVVSKINSDIKDYENLLSLNQEANCEKNNWIVELNKL